MSINRRDFNLASLGAVSALLHPLALAATGGENRRIVLASRPSGTPTVRNFRLERSPIPEPGPGQVLLKTLYLSLDPYMRGRMSAGPSYAENVKLDQVMVGGTVSKVIKSNNPQSGRAARIRLFRLAGVRAQRRVGGDPAAPAD